MLVNVKKLRTRHKNRLAKGVYEMRGAWDRFNFNSYLADNNVSYVDTYYIENYRKMEIETFFGVCDHYEQILERFPVLLTSNRKYVIGLTKVRKKDQHHFGGWRWIKWGEYIGNKKPTEEYLYDEKEIEEIYVFEIYEIK